MPNPVSASERTLRAGAARSGVGPGLEGFLREVFIRGLDRPGRSFVTEGQILPAAAPEMAPKFVQPDGDTASQRRNGATEDCGVEC